MSVTMEGFSRRGADLLAGVDSDLARGAVCIARIHRDHTHTSAAARKMLPVDDDWCSNDAIAGKHRRGTRGSISDGHGKVRLAARFDSSLYGSKAEANGQRFIRDERRIIHCWYLL